jgi:hypothetical protein
LYFLPWMIVGIPALVYALSTPAWILGGDNGEMVTLFARGGVAHPPGYPLYVMLLRAFAWLPVGAPRGAALVTAGIGALSLAALLHACRVWGASVGSAAIATATFASSSLAWRLNSSAEVFGLNVLIACSIVSAAAPGARGRGWRRVAQLGLLAGLGLSNHHSIVLLMPLGLWAVICGFREDTRPWRCVVAGLVALAVGLTPYIYLYDRALHADPASSWVWGNIHDVGSLVDHFRRAEFGTTRLALRDAPLEPWAQLRHFGWWLVRDLLGLPLVMILALGASLRRVRGSIVALGAAFLLAGPAFIAMLNITPRGTGLLVVERFYLLPAALGCILSALALERLVPLARRTSAAAAVGIMVLACGFALGAERITEDHRPTVEMYVENTLRIAPPRAVLLGSGDHKFGGFLYARLVLGSRPDVDFVTPEMLYAPWYRARVSRALGIDLAAPTADRRELVTELLATGRPVAFAGPVPQTILDAGFVTYPLGTLQMILPPKTAAPEPEDLEVMNVKLLAQFELEPVASSSPTTWAGVTFMEYARTWLLLEDMLRARGQLGRAAHCHDRAVAFAPWLR